MYNITYSVWLIHFIHTARFHTEYNVEEMVFKNGLE